MSDETEGLQEAAAEPVEPEKTEAQRYIDGDETIEGYLHCHRSGLMATTDYNLVEKLREKAKVSLEPAAQIVEFEDGSRARVEVYPEPTLTKKRPAATARLSGKIHMGEDGVATVCKMSDEGREAYFSRGEGNVADFMVWEPAPWPVGAPPTVELPVV